MPLSEKQRRFVAEYLVDLNGTQAAIRAGYSPRTAHVQAARLLTKARVVDAVSEGQRKRLEVLDISATRVLSELARIGFSDVRAWFDETGKLRPLHELGDNAAKAIASIEFTREKTTRKSDETSETTVEEAVVKVKAWDKVKALELLAKNLGLLRDKIEHSGLNGGPIVVKFGGRHKVHEVRP